MWEQEFDYIIEAPPPFPVNQISSCIGNTDLEIVKHIDTVPPHYGYGVHNHEQIWGRGSVDDKACISAQFHATEEMLASREISPNDISLLFVVGEETGGDGMRRVNDLGMEWQTVIFGESTELKLASGHKGVLIFTVKAHGKAGHSGYPWLGQNANHMLMPALVALQKLELPSSEKYGNSTLNIGQMSGGVAANVIAEEAYARIGVRIAAGCPETVINLISDAILAVNEDLQLEFSDGSYGTYLRNLLYSLVPHFLDICLQGLYFESPFSVSIGPLKKATLIPN